MLEVEKAAAQIHYRPNCLVQANRIACNMAFTSECESLIHKISYLENLVLLYVHMVYNNGS